MRFPKSTYIILAVWAMAAVSSCKSVEKLTAIARHDNTDKPQSGNAAVEVTPTPSIEKQSEATDEPAIDDKTRHILYGTWTVTEIGKKPVTGFELPVVGFDSTAVQPSMIRFFARTDCNTLNGILTMNGGNTLVTAGAIASTMRFCPDAKYEQPIAEAFANIHSYKLEKTGDDDYILRLYNDQKKSVLTLQKSGMAFINGAWQVTDIGVTEIAKTTLPKPIQLVIDVPELRIHGNTGCNILNGSLVRDPGIANSLRIVDVNTTRRACPDAGIEQQLVSALAKVVTVIPDSSDDSALMRDAAGNTIIRLTRVTLERPSD